MFTRYSAPLFFLASLAVATPWGSPTTTHPVTTTVTVTASPTATQISQCNTGSLSCCNSVSNSSNPATSEALGLLGVVVQGLDVLVGMGCSPLSVVGVGSGSTCDASPVCCQNNAVGGLISIGCVPVNLHL